MTFLFTQPAVAQIRVVNITLCFVCNSNILHKTQSNIFPSQNPQHYFVGLVEGGKEEKPLFFLPSKTS